jgi:hypothetical protein
VVRPQLPQGPRPPKVPHLQIRHQVHVQAHRNRPIINRQRIASVTSVWGFCWSPALPYSLVPHSLVPAFHQPIPNRRPDSLRPAAPDKQSPCTPAHPAPASPHTGCVPALPAHPICPHANTIIPQRRRIPPAASPQRVLHPSPARCNSAIAPQSQPNFALHQHQPRPGRIVPHPHPRRRHRLSRRLLHSRSENLHRPQQPRESVPPSPLPADKSPSGFGKRPAPSTPHPAPSPPHPPPHRSAHPDRPAHAAAVVGLVCPNRFALGAATGTPARRITPAPPDAPASAPPPAPVPPSPHPAPPPSASAAASAAPAKTPPSAAAPLRNLLNQPLQHRHAETCTITGSHAGRCFASKIRATAAASSAFAPSP